MINSQALGRFQFNSVPRPNFRDSPINFVVVVLIFVAFFAYYVDTLLAYDFLLYILDFRLNPA